MKAPTKDTIRAIKNLENNVFWKEIVGWIQDSLFAQSVANNKNTGENTIKMQGRCLELEDILGYIKRADTFIENAKEAERMDRKE
jgi:hypothetical protein